MGRDQLLSDRQSQQRRFNPRAHVGRDLTKEYLSSSIKKFQSTRPRGARHVVVLRDTYSVLFQSTRPRGARLLFYPDVQLFKKFQSTRPRGARHNGFNKYEPSFQFQSTRPRGARQSLPDVPSQRGVSIHAPTWGATLLHMQPNKRMCVSIHAPTWGATNPPAHVPTYGKFQSTRPRGARHAAQ